MASPRGRGLRPGGVVRALGRLFLLVCVGFALGLIFGLVTEEPEMLADHLRGESESVDLDVAGDKGAAEAALDADLGIDSRDRDPAAPARERARDVAGSALPPESRNPSGSRDPAARRGSRDRPAATEGEELDRLPAVASSPRSARGADVAVAATSGVPASARGLAPQDALWSIQIGAFSEESAARQLAAGLEGRYPIAVLPAAGKGGRWRVRVQPIADEQRARETAERLKRDEGLPTWVTRVEGRSGS